MHVDMIGGRHKIGNGALFGALVYLVVAGFVAFLFVSIAINGSWSPPKFSQHAQNLMAAGNAALFITWLALAGTFLIARFDGLTVLQRRIAIACAVAWFVAVLMFCAWIGAQDMSTFSSGGLDNFMSECTGC